MAVAAPPRDEAVDLVATNLLTRSSRLIRLMMAAGDRELSRTETGTLATLLERPRRITELAETEALAQPTVTKVVDKLQARGLVARERAKDDGRVVMVTITDAGAAALQSLRAANRERLLAALTDLSDTEVTELASATETLGRLIERLQA